ncbi:hypothetical protein ACPRNU_25385 [Chromobacterium vaccinii]|uniref:hypothetical protein n=1 Tax=Chromobacterium vaccinii TaxID=1108595 RepID=UPI003C74C375
MADYIQAGEVVMQAQEQAKQINEVWQEQFPICNRSQQDELSLVPKNLIEAGRGSFMDERADSCCVAVYFDETALE